METKYEDILKDHHLKFGFRCFKQRVTDEVLCINAHWHEYIELLYFNDGQATIYLNGKLHIAKKDDLLIVNSKEAHHIESSDQSTEYTVIQFDPDILHMSSTVFTLKYILPFSEPSRNFPRLFKSHELTLTSIPKRIEDIYTETSQNNYAYELAVQGNITMIFLDIVRAWHRLGIDVNTEVNINKKDMDWLTLAIQYIEDNFDQEISAKKVSEICSISYNYFSARFKKLLGRSFSSHLTFIRLRQAEYKLISSSNSITNIAYECGFSSTSYFISTFAKYKGMTPQNYRTQLDNT